MKPYRKKGPYFEGPKLVDDNRVILATAVLTFYMVLFFGCLHKQQLHPACRLFGHQLLHSFCSTTISDEYNDEEDDDDHDDDDDNDDNYYVDDAADRKLPTT